MASDPPSPPSQLPGAIRLAGAALIALGLGELALGAFAAPLWGFGAWLDPGWGDGSRLARGALATSLALTGFVVVGGASVAAGVGLWLGRRWAWLLATALAVVYVPGGFVVVGLGLLALLRDPEVKARFEPPAGTPAG